MPPSARSRPFVFTFYPQGFEADDKGQCKPRIIPINSFQPIEMENDHFKGEILVIHETGNEPGLHEADEKEAEEGPTLRGVEIQIQGKFKQAGEEGGKIALWAGGELVDVLKLGWFMQNVVKLAASFAKKKTEGRLQISLGQKGPPKEVPFLGFPVAQCFTIITTKPGETPPKLGGPEIATVPWQGPAEVSVNSKDTYTLKYTTGYVDLCSWELLKVPGVSPLPLENMLGEIISSRVMLYDLQAAGSHANWRKGVLIEWLFSRAAPGDNWAEDDELDGRKDEPENLTGGVAIDREASGRQTPTQKSLEKFEADEQSDGSDESADEEDLEADDIEIGDIANAAAGADDNESDSSSEGSLIGEDEEELAKVESQLLENIEGWKPRQLMSEGVSDSRGYKTHVPFYIEAVDRRRRKRLRVWYVIRVVAPNGKEWWHAKSINELAGLCGKRRTLRARVKMFRKGGVRGCQCYGVQTLEQLRNIFRTQLSADNSALKRAVMKAASADTGSDSENEVIRTGSKTSVKENTANKENEEVKVKDGKGRIKASLVAAAGTMKEAAGTMKDRAAHPAELARKLRRKIRRTIPPPQFLIGSGSAACELAFKFASEGRNNIARESMVGAVHFEGRLCEELLRLSKDGTIRSFTPNDCDKPRLKLGWEEIMGVDPIEGLFLGRFHRFQVHTALRAYMFCCADQSDRDEWIKHLVEVGKSATADQQADKRAAGFASIIANSLMDTTRARRWRPKKRLVLNDRILLDDNQAEPPAMTVVEGMLEQVIAFRSKDQLSNAELTEFLDQTCLLKAVRFSDLEQNDLLAFWMNVYHCLLLHGRLLLGTPKSRRELSRFMSRVSYLVGQRPVSLREIERNILRLPNLDSVTGLRATSRARARQVVGFCGLCRRRAKEPSVPSQHPGGGGSSPSGSSPRSQPRQPRLDDDDGSERGSRQMNQKGNKMACFPMVQVHMPSAPWSRRKVNVCLFLGRSPEAFAVPKQDLRVVLCLNRGNLSCLANVPVFNLGATLDAQMDSVAQDFLTEFARVTETDGRAQSAILPHCCKCLKREMNMDNDSMLNFIWKFMPSERGQPMKKMQIRYEKYKRDPQQAFQHSTLSGSGLGSEFAVIKAASQALAKLAEKGYQGRKDWLWKGKNAEAAKTPDATTPGAASTPGSLPQPKNVEPTRPEKTIEVVLDIEPAKPAIIAPEAEPEEKEVVAEGEQKADEPPAEQAETVQKKQEGLLSAMAEEQAQEAQEEEVPNEVVAADPEPGQVCGIFC